MTNLLIRQSLVMWGTPISLTLANQTHFIISVGVIVGFPRPRYRGARSSGDPGSIAILKTPLARRDGVEL